MSILPFFFNSWTWKMAWRDSRRSRRRLLLFSSSIILGIAALAAIGSFGQQMEEAIGVQAKSLLGADLVVTARDPFDEKQEEVLTRLGGEQSREISFTSMAYFVKGEHARLVQIRALGGGFPFYGTIETEPSAAGNDFKSQSGALVEQALMDQFGAKVGDTVRIGEKHFPILGALRKVPGETVAFATIAPRVYIPMSDLDETGLLTGASLARYKVYFRFSPETDAEALVEKFRPRLEKERLGFDTVEERKQDLGRAMENLNHFLYLVGFVALLLGGVGISSAIHVHIKQKLKTVAVLRCLGSSSSQAFAVYLVQALVLGIAGAVTGGLLGLIVQWALPGIIADFMPIEIVPSISWLALLKGVLIGLGICMLFALLPLLPVRRVSPLAVFRAGFDNTAVSNRDPALWICYAAIGIAILAFGISQSRRWTVGVGFGVGLWITFGLLALVAKGIIQLARRGVPSSLPYVIRQGIANLYRPNNRTLLLMLSLGLGTFLILTLHLVQKNLVQQLFPAEQKTQGNAVLFDIQSDQKDTVVQVLKTNGFPVLQHAPIVTMRIQSINGKTVEEIRKSSRRDGTPGWVLNREYRSTYRDELTNTEKLTSGTWHSAVAAGTEPVPVSLETGIAQRLKVGLGDEIVFDIQGIPIKTVVSSMREVDWRRLHPNFFVVFPTGVLEEAPSFHVMLTRVNSAEDSARLQREVVGRFSNVSVVDLTLVLQTLDSVLEKISFVIRFLALFTVGTGILVLAGAVLTGRYQRIQESILLRTLGASRSQVLQVLTVEYFMLGVFASLTGVVLAIAASWALSAFVFKVGFAMPFIPIAVALLAVSTLTVLAGLLTNRGINKYPPLEVLRAET